MGMYDNMFVASLMKSGSDTTSQRDDAYDTILIKLSCPCRGHQLLLCNSIVGLGASVVSNSIPLPGNYVRRQLWQWSSSEAVQVFTKLAHCRIFLGQKWNYEWSSLTSATEVLQLLLTRSLHNNSLTNVFELAVRHIHCKITLFKCATAGVWAFCTHLHNM